jgi:hypothetical protein
MSIARVRCYDVAAGRARRTAIHKHRRRRAPASRRATPRHAVYELAKPGPCEQERPDAEFAQPRAIAARRATAALSA